MLLLGTRAGKAGIVEKLLEDPAEEAYGLMGTSLATEAEEDEEVRGEEEEAAEPEAGVRRLVVEAGVETEGEVAAG